MGLENTVAKYQVDVVKTGSGAAQAAEEFVALDNAVKRASASAAVSNASLSTLKQSSVLLKAEMRELRSVGALLGSQMFPQLTMAAFAATDSLKAVRAAASFTGAGVGLTAAAVAGLTATIYAGVEAFKLYKARQGEATSAKMLAEQQDMLAGKIRTTIALLQEQLRITSGKAAELNGRLNAGDLRGVTSDLRDISGTKEEIDSVKKLTELRRTMFEDTLEGYAKERYEIQKTKDERIAEIAELAKKAGHQLSPQSLAGLQETAIDAQRASTARLDQKRLAEEGVKEMQDFEQLLTETSLHESETRVQQADREYQARVNFYQQLFTQGKITEDKLTELDRDASIKKEQILKKEREQYAIHVASIKEMEASAAQSFASGFANAFVEFVSGTKSAGDAFKDFAASFLRGVAEMIIQAEVLAAIKAIAGLAGGGTVFAAGGGFFPTYAAAGVSGVQEVSRATYLPKFNVVAGEAGREMLTVLARPRFMQFGGVEAVVGKAGNNTLAITNASQLAASQGGGGAGGRVVIEIMHSDEAKAQIIDQAVDGAEVRITRKANQHGALRNAIKQAAR